MKYEIKYAVAEAGQQTVRDALLPIDGETKELTLHFFDTAALSRLKEGRILRIRQMNNIGEGGSDDATSKLRGPGAAAAAAQYGNGSDERKLEGDKNVGAVAKDSFSITTAPPLVDLASVLAGGKPLVSAFEGDAVALSGLPEAEWGTLLAYGPIQARKWKAALPGWEKEVSVEHWTTTTGTTLLEVSAKVKEDKVEAFEKALRHFMEEELKVSQLAGSKTEFALQNSASRALGDDGV